MGGEGRPGRDRARAARGQRRPCRRDRARLGADSLRRAALLAAAALAAGCAATADGTSARASSVRDGDTILLAGGDRVRLLQVDAPELGRECYGDEARAELRRLVGPGDELDLRPDPALDGVDRFGRLLRYVFVGGRNVNVELVRRGAAAPYFYRGARGTHARALLAAAEEARSRRRGLWGECPTARLRPGRAVDAGPPR